MFVSFRAPNGRKSQDLENLNFGQISLTLIAESVFHRHFLLGFMISGKFHPPGTLVAPCLLLLHEPFERAPGPLDLDRSLDYGVQSRLHGRGFIAAYRRFSDRPQWFCLCSSSSWPKKSRFSFLLQISNMIPSRS